MKFHFLIFATCFIPLIFLQGCSDNSPIITTQTKQEASKHVEKKEYPRPSPKTHNVGDVVDSFNGVNVYYNGNVSNVLERNTRNGYNLGLKYQCVEFVKRYYYEYFDHEMPNSWGDAKDFFQQGLADGQKNRDRNLIQYTNPSKSKPQVNDLLVYEGTLGNPYGHVAIISEVSDSEIEIIQQNPGANAPSRVVFKLENNSDKWQIKNSRIMGWLRKE